jgi:putative DNA primase/helicase
MMNTEQPREIARGKWAGLLGQWLSERALTGRHTACPSCGGDDRFRFDDLDGAGTWICSHCGAGDGFTLLQSLSGMDFRESVQYVKKMVGRIEARPIKEARSEDAVRDDLRRVWGEAAPIEAGDPVWKYLERRCGIRHAPQGVRYHPGLTYRHDSGIVTRHPAMLAQVIGHDCAAVSIHRTYLTDDGQKAAVPVAKKLMTPVRKIERCAIRLTRPIDGWLGIAEGIETALCASQIDGGAVWSCISAGVMESFTPPEGTELLVIYADNDASFTGQASAYTLARKLTAKGLECRVRVPNQQGDWADYYAQHTGRVDQ